MTPNLAIIIPVLNDEQALTQLLAQLSPWRSCCEIIVVDGGSTDDSGCIAARDSDSWLLTDKGRARQMQAGAEIATAPRLWFLHADSGVSSALIESVLNVPASDQWGYASVRLDDERFIYRVIGFAMNLRSRLTGIATGDQGIFVNRDVFLSSGGFAPIPLMEDVELSARLRRLVPPVCLRDKLLTSARRWRENGVWRTILLMWWLRFQFFAGVSPERLYRRYYPAA